MSLSGSSCVLSFPRKRAPIPQTKSALFLDKRERDTTTVSTSLSYHYAVAAYGLHVAKNRLSSTCKKKKKNKPYQDAAGASPMRGNLRHFLLFSPLLFFSPTATTTHTHPLVPLLLVVLIDVGSRRSLKPGGGGVP